MKKQSGKKNFNLLLIPSLKSEMPTCEKALSAISNRWCLCLFELIESKNFFFQKRFLISNKITENNEFVFLLCPCMIAID